MAVIKKTQIFRCDICPQEYDNGQMLRDVAVPCRFYESSGEKYTRTYTKLSLCPTCLDKFWEACDTNFAVVENSDERGVKVYPFFDVEKDDSDDIRWVGYCDNIEKSKKKEV